MRLAVSAVTGLSGLVLLGLSIYGHPAVYVHVAREHFADWFHEEHEAYRARQGAGDDKMSERMAALQQQVAALQAELAQRQAAMQAAQGSAGSQPQPPESAPAPVNATTAAAQLSRAPGAETSQAVSRPTDAGASSSNPAGTPVASQGSTGLVNTGVGSAGVTGIWSAPSPGPALPTASTVAPTVADVTTPVPDRHDAAAAKPPRKPAPTAEPDVPTFDATAGKPVPKAARPATVKRPETDDSQSVLARLRGSGAPPLPTPRSDGATAAGSPAMSRLTAAQAALNVGRADEAVRLLQEVQLQLVFRPVDAPGGDPEAAGQGASDVARALEALSANNVPASQRYVNRALADISGNRTNLPAGVSPTPVPGYAPAYPSR